jgi:hypothetical protein
MKRILVVLALVMFGLSALSAQELTPASELTSGSGVWIVRQDVAEGDFAERLAPVCPSDQTTLCLHGGWLTVRFTINWTADPVAGKVIQNPFRSSYGGFWTESEDNPEISLKVIDGCAVNNRLWLYAGGLTDRAMWLTVTDGLGNVTHYVTFPGRSVAWQDTSTNFKCPPK